MLNNFDPNAPASKNSNIYGLPSEYSTSQVILVPIPYEATTSYGSGTSRGPEAIRQASAQVDLFDITTGRPYEAGIFMLEESKEIREYNKKAKVSAKLVIENFETLNDKDLQSYLNEVNQYGELVNQFVYKTTKKILAENHIVGIVGGDHSVPFGAIKAYSEQYNNLGILHIDAHADLRESYEGFTWSHASIMYNVITHLPDITKLVQVGIRDFCEAEMQLIKNSNGRIVSYFDEQLSFQKFIGTTWSSIVKEIINNLPKNVYLSFDIDGLDPYLCPNTGTPVPGGLTFQEAIYLISSVVESGRCIVGFDLTEIAPGVNEWDANIGARLLYKIIGHTLLSQI